MTYTARERQHQEQLQLRNGRRRPVEQLHQVVVDLCRRDRRVEWVKLTPAGAVIVKLRRQ